LTLPTSSLLRQVGVFSATAIVVSNMVGTGIFTMSGLLAGQLGTARLLLMVWVVGAICALAGAFCYSELGINFPSSGGDYVYLTEAFGPIWGFMTGWVSFFAGFSAPIALAALAIADYLGYFFPALKQSASVPIFGSGDWTFRLGGAQITAGIIVAIFTIVNCLGIRIAARFQNLLTGAKILVIMVLLIAGFAFGHGSWSHFSVPAVRNTATPVFYQFFVSLFFIYLAYSGWNAATYIAEELKQPARTLPLSLSVGTTLVAALFLALNVLFIYAAPMEQLKGVPAVGALAAQRLFGPAVAGLFWAGMAVSLLATVNAMITIGPRVYYAMAQNGAFFAKAAQVHPRWHTPVTAIVTQGICTVLMTATPFINLAFFIGFALNFFAVMSVASLFVFRRRPGWQKIRAVSFLYPLLPVFFILVGFWMTIFGLTFNPRVSFVALLMIVSGAVVYRLRSARLLRASN
jgi:APA family basic amino acid/polyamine antiporter